ncbi:30S ribosome-binding factor RbfA [Kushneria aurantia]|uniref:Ribosome-binding factor A n=1 Tax=Kushneria aurantia TaxID=504092 RepID=A0ABV6G676_9GAMM|nr:30S ribosome-binding factor RbfA [Kushneria aurantia]
MREFSRTDRVGEQLAHELALLIQREIKDPRLGMVTVNSARVSRDLGYADVYITLMGENDEQRIGENLAVLKRARGFLRSRVARTMQLRHVPELRFHYDESVTRGHQMAELIDRAVESDRERGDDDEGTRD